jgi:hypothetical protein
MVGVKCIGCGKEKGVRFYKVILFSEERKRGEALLALCNNCYTVFSRIKEKIIEKVSDKFIDNIEIVVSE